MSDYINYSGVLETESFRNSLATVDKSGKRKWVFAQRPHGNFYNYRTYVSWVFFLIFFGLRVRALIDLFAAMKVMRL